MYEGSDYWRADDERLADMCPQEMCPHLRVDSYADETRTKTHYYCVECGCAMTRHLDENGSLVFYPK